MIMGEYVLVDSEYNKGHTVAIYYSAIEKGNKLRIVLKSHNKIDMPNKLSIMKINDTLTIYDFNYFQPQKNRTNGKENRKRGG